MKLIALKDKLLNAAHIAEKIVGKKESLPVLSCIFIDADRDCSVRATNLEAAVEIRIIGEIEEKGKVAVPASILSQTLRSIRSDKVQLKTEGLNLVIESRGTRTLIKALPHEEFPLFPSGVEDDGINLSRESTLRGLASVLYAASPSMIRPELGSVYISVRQGEVAFVATDSFRLAEKKIKEKNARKGADILIPLKHAGELIHILERIANDHVRLFTEEAQLTVSTPEFRFVSRVIDASFPNYIEIVPKTSTTEATLLKNDFAEMLRKARVFSGGESRVGLHVYPKKKIFTATAQNQDVGEMSDFLEAAVSGDDIDINFHIGYLSDCLASIASDSIALGFSGPGKPLVIRGISDSSFMYLVMPLNR